MQDWPDALIAELSLQPTTLCRLYVVAPLVGTPLLFTDHDRDVTIGDDIYRADRSFQASAIENTIGGANTNLELSVLLHDDRISYNDVMARRYQGALVTIYIASYGNLGAGKGALAGGRVGSFAVPSKLEGTMSIVGGTGLLDAVLTDVYQPTCRAAFCDPQCGLDINDFSLAFTVATIVDDMAFTQGAGGTDGQFNLGTLTWATGDNEGITQEVATSLATGAVGLFYPPPYAMQVGDTGTLFQGCAFTLAACTAYNNVPNMRAEPFVPGDDYVQAV